MQDVPQIAGDIFAWLVDFGLAKPKVQNKFPAAAQPVPARLLSGFASGESFVELLNAIFTRHSVKQKLATGQGDQHKCWAQVAKGLKKLNVELNDDILQQLAGRDATTALQLLVELHYTYRQWSAEEIKRKRREAAARKLQPPSNHDPGSFRSPDARGGYAARTPMGYGVGGCPRDLPAGPSRMDDPGNDGDAAVEVSRGDDSCDGATGDCMPMKSPASLCVPGVHEKEEVGHSIQSISGDVGVGGVSWQCAPDRPQAAMPDRKPVIADQRLKQDVHSPDELLISLQSGARELETAQSVPELLGISMVQSLNIDVEQARNLLASNGRRLARAFADQRDRQRQYLIRWLNALANYRGVIAELLFRRPGDAPWFLEVLGAGLQAVSSDVAETALHMLASVCSKLAFGGMRNVCANWLVEGTAAVDVATLLPSTTSTSTVASAADLLLSCCQNSLLPLFAHHLKHASSGEQEYLSVVHTLLDVLLRRQGAADACIEQGLLTHFLARCVQRLGDERSTAGTQQVAALMATDLWLAGAYVDGSPSLRAFSQDALPDLLSSLQLSASRGHSAGVTSTSTSRMVAFSCLVRLLGALCERMDADHTPAVYRAFVYALVETESTAAKNYAMRSLMTFLRHHDGVPVGILVDLVLKKQEVCDSGKVFSQIDLELFLVIVRHPRCSLKHAELLAQALARLSVEDCVMGRAATVPLLAILHKFCNDPVTLKFLEKFVQIILTKLIQRGLPQPQVRQIHEILTKVVSLPKYNLQFLVRDLVLQVCRSYLTSYEALHPNLESLLGLWPSEAATLNKWANEAFQLPARPIHSAQDGMGLEVESVTSSVHAQGGEQQRWDGPQMDKPLKPNLERVSPPSAEVPAVHETCVRSSADVAVAPATESGQDPNRASLMQALACETEALRDELNRARDGHKKALEDANRLRSEIEDARELQQKVQNEVKQLHERRNDLIARRSLKGGHANQEAQPSQPHTSVRADPTRAVVAASGQDRRGASKGPTKAPSTEEVAQAVKLFQEFDEAFKAIFLAYGKTRRTPAGKEHAVAVNSLSQFLADFELSPVRLPKNALLQLIRSSKLRPGPGEDGAWVPEDTFISLLQSISEKTFQTEEVTPFRDFDLEVPMVDGLPWQEPPTRPGMPFLKAQAMIQHLLKVAAGSKIATVRTVRPMLTRSLRKYVLAYAKTVLKEFNERLDAGREVYDSDLPEGFELIIAEPEVKFSVPGGLPIPEGERIAAELLDSVIAEALGIHFLEPTEVRSARTQVRVAGKPDLELLEPAQALRTANSNRQDPRVDTDQPNHSGGPVNKSTRGGKRPQAPPNVVVVPPLGIPKTGLNRGGNAASAPSIPTDGEVGTRNAKTKARKRIPSEDDKDPLIQQQPKRDVSGTGDGKNSSRRRSLSEESQGNRRENQHGNRAPQPKPSVGRDVSLDLRGVARRDSSARQVSGRSSSSGAAGRARSNSRVTAPVGRRTTQGTAREDSPGQDSPRDGKLTKAKMLQQHASASEETKMKHAAVQAALDLPTVRKTMASADSGFRRIFDFFAGWKGNAETMNLAGFLKFGECFGLLNKDALTLIFRQAHSQDLTAEFFPKVIFICVVRLLEIERKQQAGVEVKSSAEDLETWARGFRQLCRHLLVQDGKAMRRALDDYRKHGVIQAKFVLGENSAEVVSARGIKVDQVEGATASQGESSTQFGQTPVPEQEQGPVTTGVVVEETNIDRPSADTGDTIAPSDEVRTTETDDHPADSKIGAADQSEGLELPGDKEQQNQEPGLNASQSHNDLNADAEPAGSTNANDNTDLIGDISQPEVADADAVATANITDASDALPTPDEPLAEDKDKSDKNENSADLGDVEASPGEGAT